MENKLKYNKVNMSFTAKELRRNSRLFLTIVVNDYPPSLELILRDCEYDSFNGLYSHKTEYFKDYDTCIMFAVREKLRNLGFNTELKNNRFGYWIDIRW